jgi:rhodanese-related sulfurtransferase
VKHILLEALVVSMVGAALAFSANRVSPQGLDLTRNYFQEPAAGVSSAPPNVSGTNATSPLDLLRQKLEEAGLQLASSNDVQKLFRDPRRAQNLVVFLDARNDEEYAAGHIPGAYQFDYYHPEKYLGTVLPLCNEAEQVVVYCNGGDCEASLHAAMMLGNDAGVSKGKLFVYGGGITEWTEQGQPVETGARNSGTFAKPAK